MAWPKKKTLGKCVLSVQENEAQKGIVGLDFELRAVCFHWGNGGSAQSGTGVTVTAGLMSSALEPSPWATLASCSAPRPHWLHRPCMDVCCCLSLSTERPTAACGPRKLRDHGLPCGILNCFGNCLTNVTKMTEVLHQDSRVKTCVRGQRCFYLHNFNLSLQATSNVN